MTSRLASKKVPFVLEWVKLPAWLRAWLVLAPPVALLPLVAPEGGPHDADLFGPALEFLMFSVPALWGVQYALRRRAKAAAGDGARRPDPPLPPSGGGLVLPDDEPDGPLRPDSVDRPVQRRRLSAPAEPARKEMSPALRAFLEGYLGILAVSALFYFVGEKGARFLSPRVLSAFTRSGLTYAGMLVYLSPFLLKEYYWPSRKP